MIFDKEINIALVGNLKLKAKILATLFGIIFCVQVIVISYFYFRTSLFTVEISLRKVILGPAFILMAFLLEWYSLKYYDLTLKSGKGISSRFAYIVTFVEISFPTFIILFASQFIQNTKGLSIYQLLHSPPVYIYFVMISLSALMLDFRLSCFAGLTAAVELLLVFLRFTGIDSTYSFVEIPNNFTKALMMVVCGVVAGLVSKKIKEAVLSSLQSKDDLIHKLDSLVKEKTAVVVQQKEELWQKNKDITDSINYAKRIQNAKLPQLDEIYSDLKNAFVLFIPKDIVSGDFYFFHKINDHSIAIAAADCTGHGVPGALMSMIGYEKLNEALSQYSDVSAILKQVNRGMKRSLRQSDKAESTRDGMDIALCTVDLKKYLVNFSGANRPIWIIRKGEKSIEETKATKKAIGGLTEDDQDFESHVFQLTAGDTFYIFSDGYADTFSGENGKKLTTKKFKEILLAIQDKPMKEQEKYLDNFIENWKRGTEQVDDILIIGVRL